MTNAELETTATVLATAKTTAMDNEGRRAIAKIYARIKPEAKRLAEYRDNVRTTLGGEKLKEMSEMAQRYRDDKDSLTPEELRQVNDYFAQLSDDYAKAVADEMEAEAKVEITKLTAAQLDKLMESNPELTVSQIDALTRIAD